jgi:heme oxygenase
VRFRLQRATQDLHRSVERHFALTGRIWTEDTYRALLQRLWGIYSPLERALTRLDWQDSGIVMRDRCKLFWLNADLSHLGMDQTAIARLEICRDLPQIEGPAVGLGALYVLEGATLGGQVILRTLQPQLGISPQAGGQFFASYGRDIGEKWRDYLASLEQFGERPQTADVIERAALDTFAAFDRWLSRHAPDLAAFDERRHD